MTHKQYHDKNEHQFPTYQIQDIKSIQNFPESKEIDLVVDYTFVAIDEVSTCAKATPRDDALKGFAILNHLLASLESPQVDLEDVLSLLEEAELLSVLMRTLVDSGENFRNNFQISFSEFNDFSLLVEELQNAVHRIIGSPEHVLPPELTTAPPEILVSEFTEFEHLNLTTASTFEDIVAVVAYNVHQEATQKGSQQVNEIAKKLVDLSKAARDGDRQQLLRISKTVSEGISAYASYLHERAKIFPLTSDRERIIQDKIFRNVRALRDFATQLKILVAVKATTIEDSKDTDETLGSLARNLGLLLVTSLQEDFIQQTEGK